VTDLGIALLVVLLILNYGGIALRGCGIGAILAGTIGLAVSGDPTGLLVVALGTTIWLAGHRLLASRDGAYRSALARRLLERTERRQTRMHRPGALLRRTRLGDAPGAVRGRGQE
jgi:hypothetical protein